MMQNGGKEGVDGGLKKLLGVFAIIPVIVMFNFMYIAKVIHNIELPVISIIQIITVINFLRGFFLWAVIVPFTTPLPDGMSRRFVKNNAFIRVGPRICQMRI